MKDSKNIRCALITINPFPIGNVATVRYTSYMNALAKKGIFAKVIVLSPSRTATLNNHKSGKINGVYFKYMSQITWRKSNPNIAYKACYYIYGLFASLKSIQKDNINTIILYEYASLSFIFYWIATRLMSIRLLTDRSEYPYGYSEMTKWEKEKQKIRFKVFDGIIVMTKELMNFYSTIKSRKASLFHLPMTVDNLKFDKLKKEIVSEPYICVMIGSHNRDGLYESILAYSEYCRISGGGNLRLKIFGNYQMLPVDVKEKISITIEQSGLKNKIDIIGAIPSNEIPQVLINSDCLLTTPNRYISGGFPTKLGEYLSAGVPVIATAAGEIGNYMEDGKNIFLLKPGNIEGIAQKIKFIQDNRDEALKVAEKGKEFCKKVFNADTYSDKLIEWIASIK